MKNASSMSDGEKIALGIGAAIALGGVGYLIYKSSAGSSSASPGNVTLGPGGSSAPGLPAATAANDFEAGAGENAPLVPTGT